jgi:hypothetical protein
MLTERLEHQLTLDAVKLALDVGLKTWRTFLVMICTRNACSA